MYLADKEIIRSMKIKLYEHKTFYFNIIRPATSILELEEFFRNHKK